MLIHSEPTADPSENPPETSRGHKLSYSSFRIEELENIKQAIRQVRHRLNCFKPKSKVQSYIPEYHYDITDKCNNAVAILKSKNEESTRLRQQKAILSRDLSQNKKRLHRNFDFSKHHIRPSQAYKSAIEYKIKEVKFDIQLVEREDHSLSEYIRHLETILADAKNKNQLSQKSTDSSPNLLLHRNDMSKNFSSTPTLFKGSNRLHKANSEAIIKATDFKIVENAQLEDVQQEINYIMRLKVKVEDRFRRKIRDLKYNIQRMAQKITHNYKLLGQATRVQELLALHPRQSRSNKILKYTRSKSKGSIQSNRSNKSLSQHYSLKTSNPPTRQHTADIDPYRLLSPLRRPTRLNNSSPLEVFLGLYRPDCIGAEDTQIYDTSLRIDSLTLGLTNTDRLGILMTYCSKEISNEAVDPAECSIQVGVKNGRLRPNMSREQWDRAQKVTIKVKDLKRMTVYCCCSRVCSVELHLSGGSCTRTGHKDKHNHPGDHYYDLKVGKNRIKHIMTYWVDDDLVCISVKMSNQL